MTSSLQPISDEEYERIAFSSNCAVGIENTPVWDAYDALVGGRELLNGSRYVWVNGQARALVTFKWFSVYRMRYLWARSAPSWIGEPPSAEEEALFIEDVRRLAREAHATFVRMHVWHDHSQMRPPIEDVAYDTTVFVDVGGDYFPGLKKRGRRDINKARRECPGVVVDRSDITLEQMRPLVKMLRNTLGDLALPDERYFEFVEALSKHDAAQLLTCETEDGDALGWLVWTKWGRLATYYFSASTPEGKRMYVPDLLLGELFERANAAGCDMIDLMGVGSATTPGLDHLTTFKTKFAPASRVAVARELVINRARYFTRSELDKVRHAVRGQESVDD